jgi:hypothetical protein
MVSRHKAAFAARGGLWAQVVLKKVIASCGLFADRGQEKIGGPEFYPKTNYSTEIAVVIRLFFGPK